MKPFRHNDDSDSERAETDNDRQPSRNSYQWTWNRRYVELVKFYKLNGHCAVPSNYEPNRKLGNWVRTQRAQFKLYRNGVTSTSMTAERVELLDKINFPWKVKCDWLVRFQELENYYSYYGNSRVPTNWHNNRSLGRWVDRQRTAYRFFREGRPTTMTADRIKMLEQLDFQWKVRDDWFERYNELNAYYKTHGDSLVPESYPESPSLSKWVDNQRQQYRLYNRNRPCGMNEEKIKLLEQVDFQWKMLENWYDRFRELEEYVLNHGDTLVPQHYEPNPSLGVWVRNQRTLYKLFKEGKPGKLSQERVQMLEGLSFEWNAYDAKWMTSFVELGKHMRIHGLGTLPSFQANRRLRSWAEEQRKQYWKLQDSIQQKQQPQRQQEQQHQQRQNKKQEEDDDDDEEEDDDTEAENSLLPSEGEGQSSSSQAFLKANCRLTPKRIELLDLLCFPWKYENAD